MGRIKVLFDAIGGRKSLFLLILIAVSIGTTAFVSEKYYGEMMQYLSVMFGSFCVGNGIEHFSGRKQ